MTRPTAVVYLNLRRTHHEHRAALEAAHRLGHRVALITDSAPADLPAGIVTDVRTVDTYDPGAVDEAVDSLAAELDLVGIVTWSDRDVETVSRVAARLGLPAPSQRAARTARNKVLMREAMAGHPHLVPRFARVTSWDELEKAALDIGYPAVLKPTSASGSKGIFVLDGPDGLRPAFEELMRYTTPASDSVFRDNPNELVYEEFLTGTEHSVEGVVHGGEIVVVGVTDKETTTPFCLEVGHVFPSALPPRELAAVHDLTRVVVEEFGLDDCTFHLECMVDDGHARLVEVAARGGGDFITSHLVGLATGISLSENVLRVATGLPPRVAEPTLTAGVRKVMATEEGTLDRLDGLGDALSVPGVRTVVVERTEGARVALPPTDYMSSTLAVVIAVGESPAAVRTTLRTAAGAVQPHITRNPTAPTS